MSQAAGAKAHNGADISEALKALAASVGDTMRELREIVSPNAAKPKKRSRAKSSAPHVPVSSSKAQASPEKGKARGTPANANIFTVH